MGRVLLAPLWLERRCTLSFTRIHHAPLRRYMRMATSIDGHMFAHRRHPDGFAMDIHEKIHAPLAADALIFGRTTG